MLYFYSFVWPHLENENCIEHGDQCQHHAQGKVAKVANAVLDVPRCCHSCTIIGTCNNNHFAQLSNAVLDMPQYCHSCTTIGICNNNHFAQLSNTAIKVWPHYQVLLVTTRGRSHRERNVTKVSLPSITGNPSPNLVRQPSITGRISTFLI